VFIDGYEYLENAEAGWTYCVFYAASKAARGVVA
jgi:hypothetical protein